jgi:hypothetical protein
MLKNNMTILILWSGSILMQYFKTIPNTAVIYCGILTLQRVGLKLLG